MTTRRRLPPQKLGSVIGGVFGTVFVVVNSASSPGALRAILLIATALTVVAIVAALVRLPADPTPPSSKPFGRGYWLVVAAEVLALFAGIRIIAGPLDHPEAGVAWVAVVVGVHFFALGRLWRVRLFLSLGGGLTVLGLIGLALAFGGAEAMWVDLVAGVGSGALLLAAALRGALPGRSINS